ncbi:MAG: type III pantothenate kinase [Gemmatimonadetes bacterium]|nr:type III pantothenate kinase [Gemmatimonadota bacterium]
MDPGYAWGLEASACSSLPALDRSALILRLGDPVQLVVDVGNTETVVGVAPRVTEISAFWRISSNVPRTADELTALLRALMAGDAVDATKIRRGVIGSVVPSLNQVWSESLSKVVRGPVVSVGPRSELPIRLDVDEPLTVGADRIANTLAAREIYQRDTIAVDLGTATTFDCITREGVFVGGVISPGLQAGLDWLAARTAKLPRVELQPPKSVIGRRTEACIQSGVFYQAVDAVDGIVRRIKEEWKRPDAFVVATGGFSHVIGPHLTTVDKLEPHLTLYGLAMAGERIGGTGGG